MSSSIPYEDHDPLADNPFADHSSAVTEPSHIRPPEDNDDDDDDDYDKESTIEHEPVIQEEGNNQVAVNGAHSDASQETIPSTGTVTANKNIQQEEQTSSEPEPKVDITKVLPERKDIGIYSLIIKVTGLERTGSISNKRENPTFVFDCSTNIPTFRKRKHKKLRKSIEEFQNLFKFLNSNIPESFIPSIPPTYTNYGINNEEDHDTTVSNFQEWFNRICSDPLILRNEELAFFIESDYGTYIPINPSVAPISGLKRKTLKQLAPPFDESLPLAEFRPMVKSIYVNVQNIQEKLLKASKTRRLLVQEENEFGQKFGTLTTINENESKLYKRYGKIMTAVGDINSIIATMDMATLYDGLEWIVQDSYIVKESLTNRHFIMRDLLQAQQNSKNKQEMARKLRSRRDTNPMKVEDAIRSLKIASTTEQNLTLKLHRVTGNMVIERSEWINWYEKWLIKSIKMHTLRRIEYERKKLSLLERVRSEVRRADMKGGLSRLGRHTVSKKEDEVSQSTHGDSWTGEVRRHSQQEINTVLHTEFDKSLSIESTHPEGTSADTSLNSENNDTNMLDAKSAAHMLGISSYNGR